jgi:hypothetical protein
MVTVRLPVGKANDAIRNGSIGRIIQSTLERIQPECAYFFVENGKRTMRAVFDLKSPQDQVTLFEPVFLELDAELEFATVMTAAELAMGLQALPAG